MDSWIAVWLAGTVYSRTKNTKQKVLLKEMRVFCCALKMELAAVKEYT